MQDFTPSKRHKSVEASSSHHCLFSGSQTPVHAQYFALNLVNDGVLLIQHERIVFANVQAQLITQLSQTELLFQSVFELPFLMPSQQTSFSQIIKRVKENKDAKISRPFEVAGKFNRQKSNAYSFTLSVHEDVIYCIISPLLPPQQRERLWCLEVTKKESEFKI